MLAKTDISKTEDEKKHEWTTESKSTNAESIKKSYSPPSEGLGEVFSEGLW